ncbi:odorant receptor Or2-like [Malaya genurostris]|uniref:odorant receptor Or2-like n=1 Tax=Malaya genurostris TaxID=325434 RepID=UPI0026F38463|nr:odorant receptor Or2-like [Malaya genurostris]
MEDEYIRNMVRSLTKRARVTSWANIGLALVVGTSYLTYPLFATGRILPYGFYVPGVEKFDSPQWEVLYIFQFLLSFPGASMYIPFTSFFANCTVFGLIQLKTIEHQLQTFKKPAVNDDLGQYARLKSIIRQHQRVIVFVRELNSLVTNVCLIELLSFGLMVVALLFLIIVVRDEIAGFVSNCDA